MFLPQLIYYSATTTQHTTKWFHVFISFVFFLFDYFSWLFTAHMHMRHVAVNVFGARHGRDRVCEWVSSVQIVIVRLRNQHKARLIRVPTFHRLNSIKCRTMACALAEHSESNVLAMCWWLTFPIGCYFCAADHFTRAHMSDYRLRLCVKIISRAGNFIAAGTEPTQQQTIARR